ncbi:Guanylate cyclase soluble subunit beta-1 [Nymphon striatum]|nr:Guanylate cyclase soluble subunit beta-1 [Nymphon striatum]
MSVITYFYVITFCLLSYIYREKAEIQYEDGPFLTHRSYGDEITMKLISTTCEVLGELLARSTEVYNTFIRLTKSTYGIINHFNGQQLDLQIILPTQSGYDGGDFNTNNAHINEWPHLETALEVFGGHFLVYCQHNGYDRILRVLGGNMFDMLSNLDNLHDHLDSQYPGIQAPSFKCSVVDGSLVLHYYSERKGLEPIVRGLIKAIGKSFFNTELKVQTIPDTSDGHICFKMTAEEGSDENKRANDNIFNQEIITTKSSSNKLPMLNNTFVNIFPFHMVFDKELDIIQAGTVFLRVTRLFRKKLKRKANFKDLFELIRPRLSVGFDSFNAQVNQMYVVRTKPDVIASKDPEINPVMKLKGQMVILPDSRMMFLCSPRFQTTLELEEQNVYFADIPIYDHCRDMLLLGINRGNERELVQKLEEGQNRLKSLESELENDQKKTDELLYNILPAKVAQKLRLNLSVESETFEEVSALFSDITRVLEQMLNEVVKEGRKWSIEINKDKTKVMMVTNNKQQEQEDINIKLDGVGIQQVDKFQYLGVFMDNKLDHKIDVKCAVARAKDAFLRHKEFFKNNANIKDKLDRHDNEHRGAPENGSSGDLSFAKYPEAQGLLLWTHCKGIGWRGQNNIWFRVSFPVEPMRVILPLYCYKTTSVDGPCRKIAPFHLETIGDAYIVIGSLPDYVEDHADRTVLMGLEMIKIISVVSSPADGAPLKMRIGIHTGSVMAGVVGKVMPRYCCFGNTVNLANKMESNGLPMRVNITALRSLNHVTIIANQGAAMATSSTYSTRRRQIDYLQLIRPNYGLLWKERVKETITNVDDTFWPISRLIWWRKVGQIRDKSDAFRTDFLRLCNVCRTV